MKVVVDRREATISDTSFQDTTPALFSDGYPVPRKYTCAKCGLHKAAPVYRYIIPGSVNGVICLGCRNRLLQGVGQAAAPVVSKSHKRRIGVRGISAIAIVVLVIIGVTSTVLGGFGGSTTTTSSSSSYSLTSTTSVSTAVGDPAFSSAPTILVPPTQGDAAGSCVNTTTTFTCIGTTVARGESYSVKASVNNPGSQTRAIAFTARAAAGWWVTPQNGTYTLAPGTNSVTWTVLWPATLNVTTLLGQIEVQISASG